MRSPLAGAVTHFDDGQICPAEWFDTIELARQYGEHVVKMEWVEKVDVIVHGARHATITKTGTEFAHAI